MWWLLIFPAAGGFSFSAAFLLLLLEVRWRCCLAPENYEVTRMEEYGRLWPIICSSLCGLAEFLLLEVFKLLFLPT